MKRFLLSTIFLFLWNIVLLGQDFICPSGSAGTDEPPGCLFCNDHIQGRKPNFSKTPIPGNFSCGLIENNFFIAIDADSIGNIKIHFQIKDCNKSKGLEGVLYDENFEEVSNCLVFPNNGSPEKIEISGLVPNKRYSLMIDGIEGDVCNYDILLRSDPRFGESYSEKPDSILLPPEELIQICPGKVFELSIPPVPNAEFYTWDYPNYVELVSLNKNKIELKTIRQANTPKPITVTVFKGCKSGGTSAPVFVSASPAITRRSRIRICADKLPFDIEGVTFSNVFSTREVVFPNYEGCDSIVTFTPIEDNSNINVLDTVFCFGDTFRYDDSEFIIPGRYDFFGTPSSPYLCDSLIEMTLNYTGIVPPAIECVPDSFLNLLSFKWDKIRLAEKYQILLNGNFVGEQSNIGFLYTPNFPGEQVEITVQPMNTRGCSFEPGILTCFAPDLTALVEKDTEDRVRVFPNPSTGIFQISSFSKIEKTEVFDFSGRQVLVEKGSKIDLTNYAEGIYFFKIFTKKGVEGKRVFKN